MATKITTLQLREMHGLNISHVAFAAGLSPSIAYYFFVGTPVTKEEATALLAAITTMTNIYYDLDTVEVALQKEEQATE